ncbi:hypothetical protein H1D32_07890 [Anaerobacillus sp. CMMVII]|uniref:hypothetical protein n=1 Tax=Anaerobacillus sp. CMMVII TaxID=2755588 RepID=UPI0021B7D956|nr:hypothetical protein [Anaerobacillus sp. CMMVII]MCT8137683.1 hypothetical protein [Anaerobacillus sp. CMMVII]
MRKILLIISFIFLSTFFFSYYASSEENTEDPIENPEDENEGEPEQPEQPEPEPEPEAPPKEKEKKTPPIVEPEKVEKKINDKQETPKEQQNSEETTTPEKKIQRKVEEVTNIVIPIPQQESTEQQVIEEELIDYVLSTFSKDGGNYVTSFDTYILRNILSIFLYNEPDQASLARYSDNPFFDLAIKLTHVQVEELQQFFKSEHIELHQDYEILVLKLEEFLLHRDEALSVQDIEITTVVDKVEEEQVDELVESEDTPKEHFTAVIAQFFRWLGSFFSK